MILEKAFMKKQLISALVFFGAAVVTAIGLHVALGVMKAQEGSMDLASESEFDSESGHVHDGRLYKEGEPWFGGKPHSKVAIAGDIQKISGESFEFTYEVLPHEQCDQFIVRVRGVDGVRIDQEPVTSQSCAMKITESIVIQVPRGEVGYVVLDIEMIDGSGQAKSMTRSFLASNGGGDSPKSTTEGKIEKANGKAVHVLKIE
jgi:hypothetical protein